MRRLGALSAVALAAGSLTAGVAVGSRTTSAGSSDGGPARVQDGVEPGTGKSQGKSRTLKRSGKGSTTPLRVKPGVGPGGGTGTGSNALGVAPGN